MQNSRNRRLSRSGRGWRGGGSERTQGVSLITVEHLQLLGSLLKGAGWQVRWGIFERAEENQHTQLGHPWWDWRIWLWETTPFTFDDPACILQWTVQLRSLPTKNHMEFLREGTWALLNTLCGRCAFNLPATRTDPQALGKKRTHACACCSESLCQEVAPCRSSSWTSWCSPNLPLWPSVGGQFISKRAATLTFRKLAALTGTDARVPSLGTRAGSPVHKPWRWRSGHLVDPIQAFCQWGSRTVLEFARDCHLSSATDTAAKVTKGLRLMEVCENLHQHMEIAVGPGEQWSVSRSLNKYWRRTWRRWTSSSMSRRWSRWLRRAC